MHASEIEASRGLVGSVGQLSFGRLILVLASDLFALRWDRLLKTMGIAEGARSPLLIAWHTATIRRQSRISNALRTTRSTTLSAPRTSGVIWKLFLSALTRRPAFAKATAWLVDTALFWGKRVYDFFEARITAQRIPHRTQAEVAVSIGARNFDKGFKLAKR